MSAVLLRKPEVLRRTGLSASGLTQAVIDGIFPHPIRITPGARSRAVGWVASEIEAWIKARIAGASEAETRELVEHLTAQRGQPVMEG